MRKIRIYSKSGKNGFCFKTNEKMSAWLGMLLDENKKRSINRCNNYLLPTSIITALCFRLLSVVHCTVECTYSKYRCEKRRTAHLLPVARFPPLYSRQLLGFGESLQFLKFLPPPPPPPSGMAVGETGGGIGRGNFA